MTAKVVTAIIRKFGTQERLARAIGTGQSAVAAWKRRGVIPARQQPRILRAANRLGIDVVPEDFFRVRETPQSADRAA